MAEWYSIATEEDIERIEAAWNDAPTDNLDLLGALLDIAREDVIEYAPDPPEGEEFEPGNRHVYAQLQHARSLWNVGYMNEQGDLGSEEWGTYRRQSIDKILGRIIRPVRKGGQYVH